MHGIFTCFNAALFICRYSTVHLFFTRREVKLKKDTHLYTGTKRSYRDQHKVFFVVSACSVNFVGYGGLVRLRGSILRNGRHCD